MPIRGGYHPRGFILPEPLGNLEWIYILLRNDFGLNEEGNRIDDCKHRL